MFRIQGRFDKISPDMSLNSFQSRLEGANGSGGFAIVE